MKTFALTCSLLACTMLGCADADPVPEADTPTERPTQRASEPGAPAAKPKPAPASSDDVAPAPQGIPASTAAAIAAIAEGAIDARGVDGKSIGLVVGVWTPSFTSTQGYGRTTSGGATVPDGDSVFELGSVTKVFTGMLLAERVLAGRMKLDQPVSAHLPGAPIPSFGGTPITLGNIASHGSGLPPMPDNLTGDRYNPAAGYTRARLFGFLSRTTLARAPGSGYQYSNLGIGLLGIALSQEDGGASFDEMVAQTITGPLQMADTRTDRASYPTAKLVQGHQGTAPVPPNQIDTIEAAGALRSTARDMVKFVAVHAGSGHPLEQTAALTQTKILGKANGGSCGLGMEIRTDGGITYFEKAGATSGFTARIVITRAPAVGIVVLSNSAGAELQSVAQRIHDVVRATP
jgi:CubicO group peptidase (beta-lactamase class C family)